MGHNNVSFNSKVAEKIGIQQAIILGRVYFYLTLSFNNEENIIDGELYTFRFALYYLKKSLKFIKPNIVTKRVNAMVREGLLKEIKADIDKDFDTKRYSLGYKGLSLLKKEGFDIKFIVAPYQCKKEETK